MNSQFALNILYVTFIAVMAVISLSYVFYVPLKYRNWYWGIIFGIAAILTMRTGVQIEGLFYDFRHVILALGGFVGGLPTVIMSFLLAGSYRLSQGGLGAVGGALGLLVYGMFGYCLKYKLSRFIHHKHRSIPNLLAVGLILCLVTFATILVFPPWAVSKISILKHIALPYLILTPLATALLFKVFLTLEQDARSLFLIKTFLHQCPENIIVFNEKGRVYAASREICQNESLQEYLHDPQALKGDHNISNHQAAPSSQEKLISTNQDKHLLCTTIPVKLPQDEIFHIVFLRDVSKEVIQEREMERMARLDLVSQLAAGIGHEIRNPMTTIRGFLEILGGDMKLTEYKEYFDLMKGELDRANLILSDFLSLTQDKSATYQMTNINQVISSLSPLICSNALLHNNEIQYDLGMVTDTLADEKQIRQLILNMVHNALEAMPNGGCLTIKTFPEKGSNVLAFIDQGLGISTAVADKIGTPYFTTKENGTGLGLATCYQIAARNNALIEFDTSPHGTTFYVRFKCTETDKIKKLA